MENEFQITDEIKVKYREKQSELVKIVEALAKLENSKEWLTLKELIFDKSLNSIERQILNEALMPKINTDKLYKLQGEWAWAKQYNDINRLGSNLKKQLEDIKLKLK